MLFVYHEPWGGYAEWLHNYTRGNEDMRETIHALGRHVYASRLIQKIDCVLLPSKTAEEIYVRQEKKLNPCFIRMPLVFMDEFNDCSGEIRDRFSFIATASKAKAFNKYLEAVKYIAQKDQNARFEIATRTDVTSILDCRIKELEASGRMKIQCGRPLQNSEIRAAYERSVCTWLGYDRSTQSGVMCKAFMFGSPAIATKIGSFPEYINGKNGILLEKNDDVEEIYEAYCKIKQAQEDFSKCARETFLNEFYYEAHIETLRKAISKARAAGKSSNAESRV